MTLYTGRREVRLSPPLARRLARPSYGAGDLAVAVQCRGQNENIGGTSPRWCHRPTLHQSGYCSMHRDQWARARQGAA